ncbi:MULTISPECIES: LysR family transcriptional regulator [unclassified Rhizobium]|uniref:LysR family transcriptional regulator n=1 Tax=unclassified Rhizobium TaxID=2613769 RepID=UPI001C83A89D|nr:MULTISPECIES: LysR family transcriptional regulator [unclassified Rhizobium]MBX5167930.1 LysR family transcriptional regulator [Rhizobium sp. NZLR4b]MBX5172242.1 LysR family transcriptional regulator [Rhizobium sp. NZLR1b]MBX5186115.1 LysR family transcriptional regulator [Rhizobium sp. NZLR5]MBX5193298.1 LysR family transcriptional regulator [Rhizobium sp. NZLR3b]MBX5195100.1 LysR family transcriptional regulator [Rhizobium sp. NZLR10]
MADLNDIAVFVKVAQYGSFSRAAHSLGMPVSTVSRKVTSLEEQLGVTLLQRTTRKLSLTAQGRAYFDQCSEPLAHLIDAEQALTETQKKPEGLLKISVPVIFGQEVFYEFVSSFLKTYPDIQVDLFVTNLFLDLIAENIDLGIRFGELKDSSIIAQRLGKSVRYLVAAPDYLKGRAPPSEPQDLNEHQCVLLNGRNGEAEWHLVSGGKSVRQQVSGPVSSRDFDAVSAFTNRGHGIGLLPSTYCDDEIRRGALIRLLPDWSSEEIFVHAVYPTRRFLPARLQVFLDALKAWKSPLWLPLH